MNFAQGFQDLMGPTIDHLNRTAESILDDTDNEQDTDDTENDDADVAALQQEMDQLHKEFLKNSYEAAKASLKFQGESLEAFNLMFNTSRTMFEVTTLNYLDAYVSELNQFCLTVVTPPDKFDLDDEDKTNKSSKRVRQLLIK